MYRCKNFPSSCLEVKARECWKNLLGELIITGYIYNHTNNVGFINPVIRFRILTSCGDEYIKHYFWEDDVINIWEPYYFKAKVYGVPAKVKDIESIEAKVVRVEYTYLVGGKTP